MFTNKVRLNNAIKTQKHPLETFRAKLRLKRNFII